MSVEENKALVRRFYEEIDSGNLDAMDELSRRTTSIMRRRPSPVWRQGGPASNKRLRSSGRRHLASTGSRIRSPRETRWSPA
jgi:hypothetical protein